MADAGICKFLQGGYAQRDDITISSDLISGQQLSRVSMAAFETSKLEMESG